MLSNDQIKEFLPFLPDNYLDPKVPDPAAPGWRFPLMPGVTMADLPPQAKNIGLPGMEFTKPGVRGLVVSDTDLKRIIPSLTLPKASSLAKGFNRRLSLYGMNNKLVFPDYLAQGAWESAMFEKMDENLNYSAQGLLNTFPKYFKTMAEAQAYQKRPQLIANKVYASRMGNGPEDSGDGFRNRGGGYIMLTGYVIWSLYTKYLQKHVDPDLTITKVQELVRTTEEYAIDSSLWYFAVYASLKDEAERDEFRKITKAVQGGHRGEDGRKAIFTKGLIVFGAL